VLLIYSLIYSLIYLLIYWVSYHPITLSAETFAKIGRIRERFMLQEILDDAKKIDSCFLASR